jgi:hypothetical protein
MFATPTGAEENKDEESDGGVKADDEAPIYAEGGNQNIQYKQGVEIQKSPYTKIFDVSLYNTNFLNSETN